LEPRVPSWLDLAAMGLCTWRLSSLVVNEEGPFCVFLKLRQKLGIIHDPDDKPIDAPDWFLPRLLMCVWCVSVWMGALTYLMWWISPVPVFIFAASAIAILVQRYLDGLPRMG
jgi:hypothetical protein